MFQQANGRPGSLQAPLGGGSQEMSFGRSDSVASDGGVNDRKKDLDDLKQYCSQYVLERVMYEGMNLENTLTDKFEKVTQRLKDMEVKQDEALSDSKLSVIEERILMHLNGEVNQAIETRLLEQQVKSAENSGNSMALSEAALQGIRSEVDLLKRQQSMERSVQASLRTTLQGIEATFQDFRTDIRTHKEQQEVRFEASKKEIAGLKHMGGQSGGGGAGAKELQAMREESFRNSTDLTRAIEEVSQLVEAAKVSMHAQLRDEIDRWRAEASQVSGDVGSSEDKGRMKTLLAKMEGLGDTHKMNSDLDETRDDLARLSQEVRNFKRSLEQMEKGFDQRSQELRAERLAWASARQSTENNRTTVAQKLNEVKVQLAAQDGNGRIGEPLSTVVNSITDLCSELGDQLRSELDGLIGARAASTEARIDSVERSLAKEFKRVTGELGESVGTFQAAQRAAQREASQLGPRVADLEVAMARFNVALQTCSQDRVSSTPQDKTVKALTVEAHTPIQVDKWGNVSSASRFGIGSNAGGSDAGSTQDTQSNTDQLWARINSTLNAHLQLQASTAERVQRLQEQEASRRSPSPMQLMSGIPMVMSGTTSPQEGGRQRSVNADNRRSLSATRGTPLAASVVNKQGGSHHIPMGINSQGGTGANSPTGSQDLNGMPALSPNLRPRPSTSPAPQGGRNATPVGMHRGPSGLPQHELNLSTGSNPSMNMSTGSQPKAQPLGRTLREGMPNMQGPNGSSPRLANRMASLPAGPQLRQRSPNQGDQQRLHQNMQGSHGRLDGRYARSSEPVNRTS